MAAMNIIVQPTVPVKADDEGRRVQEAFGAFLRKYENPDDPAEKVYMLAVAELQNAERNTLFVQFPHISSYSRVLATAIELQFYRLNPFLCEAVRQLVVESCGDEDEKAKLQRKEYYVAISDLKTKHQVRQLTSDTVGKLVRISGQVVRTHPVHPELFMGTFVCDDCGVPTRNVPQHFKFTQPLKCSNPQCQNRTRFLLDLYDSMFVDFQRLRIQETQEELPLGCIPRNLEIIVRGEAVETSQPGDHCDFIGTLIVVPDVAKLAAPGVRAQVKSQTRGKGEAEVEGLRGLKSLGVRDLTYKMAFLACSISSSSPVFGGIHFTHEEILPTQMWKSLLPQDQRRLKEMGDDPRIVENLCDGLFPNIYRNEQVKLGILLMLFGGVGKRTTGATLRGDINILLIGDPSMGKSQFLKTIESFSPRVIYTLFVQFPHISSYSRALATAIELQFYRLNPFLCEAVRQLVVESCGDEDEKAKLQRKEYYVAISDLKSKHQVRQLTSDTVGKLVRISGQVVRTHPVHPPLQPPAQPIPPRQNRTRSFVSRLISNWWLVLLFVIAAHLPSTAQAQEVPAPVVDSLEKCFPHWMVAGIVFIGVCIFIVWSVEKCVDLSLTIRLKWFKLATLEQEERRERRGGNNNPTGNNQHGNRRSDDKEEDDYLVV